MPDNDEDVGTGLQIYNALAAGEKVQLLLANRDEARRLRQHISVIKHRQDKQSLAVGLFEQGDLTAFSCVIAYASEADLGSEEVIMTMEFIEDIAIKRKTYTFRILRKEKDAASGNDSDSST